MTKGLLRLVLAISCLSGCGGGGGSTGGGGGGAAEPVTIQITAPQDGQVVASGAWQVAVDVSGPVARIQSLSVTVKGVGFELPPVLAQVTATGYTATVALGANANTIEADATCADGSHAKASVQVQYPFIAFTKFQEASVAIGQADMLHGLANQADVAGANTLASPLGRALLSGSTLYVPDSDNHRVLAFGSVPQSDDASAIRVLGQPGFGVTNGGTTAEQLLEPLGVAVYSGELLVADNNRVLIFSQIPTVSGAAANFVVGWEDFNTAPSGECTSNQISRAAGIWVANGKLLIADSHNHRVLIWDSIPNQSGQAANLVLGQSGFGSGHCDANASGTTEATATTLSNPTDVWSDGTRVVVADSENNRVLIWNTFPSANGQPADVVLGQETFQTTYGASTRAGLIKPNSVSSNGNQLFVSDAINNRVLIWNTFPTAKGTPADVVLGQSDYVHNQRNDENQDFTPDTSPSSRTFSIPAGVALWDDQLFVTDSRNSRVLVFQGTKPTGQPTLSQ